MNVLRLSSSRFICQYCWLNKPVVVRVELSDSWWLDKQIWVQPCFTLLLHIFLAHPACPLGFLIPNDKDWFQTPFVSDPFCSLLLMLFSLIQPVNCENRVWIFGLSASGITDGRWCVKSHIYSQLQNKKTPFFFSAMEYWDCFFFFPKWCNFKAPSGSSSWVRTVVCQQFLSFNCSLFSSPSLLFLILPSSTDPRVLVLSVCPLRSSRVFCPTRQTNLTWDPSFLGDSYCPPGKTEQVKDLCFIVVNPGVARLHPAQAKQVPVLPRLPAY